MNKPKQHSVIDTASNTKKVLINPVPISKEIKKTLNSTNKTINSFVNNSAINKSNLSNVSTSSRNLFDRQANGHSMSNKSTIKYPCQLCEFNFYDIERYNTHLIRAHKIDQRINLLQCYVSGCEEKFNKRQQLVDHLNEIHNQNVVVLTRTVHNLVEFDQWKSEIEKESGYQWIQNNSFYLNNRLRKTFICNRPATNGCKVYTLKGLTTINNHSAFCLSSIKLIENDDNTFTFEFIETHNHDE